MAADSELENHLEHCKSCIMKESVCEDCIRLNLASLQLDSVPQSLVTVAGNLEKLYLDYNELIEIPGNIFIALPQLRVLSLVGNNVSQLPPDISHVKRLEELYLNENKIKELPSSIVQLLNLKVLNLVGNELEDLGNHPENIECLQLDDNQLREIPESFGRLSNLRILDLESNSLTYLPESFGKLHKLTVLNLSSNKLKSLPASFSELESLVNLDLSSNSLKALPPAMKCCHSLRKLYIENNRISDLPDWVGHLPELLEMSLKDNLLSHQAIPESFTVVSKKLKDLDLGGNFMSSLPETFGQLENLERLHLGSTISELERRHYQNGNRLSRIPESFCQLTMLKSLNLDENQITELPESFGSLVNLEYLDLGQNLLCNLPETFGNLCSLCTCQLSKNHIEQLPSSIGQLSKLEDLRLDHNKLTELPESFAKLKQLKNLDLYRNYLHELPQCLDSLTNLIRLDIDENAFDLPYTKVPQVIYTLKYPQRDKSKADNWRGRSRLDGLKELQSDGKKAIVDKLEELSDSNVVRNAIRCGQSLWRSHGKDEESMNGDTHQSFCNDSCQSLCADTFQLTYQSLDENSDNCSWNENDNDDDCNYYDDVLDEKNNRQDEPATACLDEEDWDKEIENAAADANPYGVPSQHVYIDPYEPDTLTYEFLGTDHVFLPCAYHAKPVSRLSVKPVLYKYAEVGQFDDVSDDDLPDNRGSIYNKIESDNEVNHITDKYG